MVAGTDYTFQVQGRDFYSNNIQLNLATAMGTNYEIIYKHETIANTEVKATSFVDDGAGVYKATV
jgi:hypothetical protein